MRRLRAAVSLEKRRYKDNGFDLDLSFITPKVVAMGFPSVKLESAYRNPASECVRFVETQLEGDYLVFNLCAERARQYDAALFGGRLVCFPFADHNAPPLQLAFDAAAEIERFVSAVPGNTAVVHCKAGKGRTGLVICCWLLLSGTWLRADDALDFFGAMRTEDGNGVTIPSQRRYVRYFGELMRRIREIQEEEGNDDDGDGDEEEGARKQSSLAALWTRVYTPPTLALRRVTLSPLPRLGARVARVRVALHRGGAKLALVAERQFALEPAAALSERARLDFAPDFEQLAGDYRLTVSTSSGGGGGESLGGGDEEELFHCWFNTLFVGDDGRLVLRKQELDEAIKDKRSRVFDDKFRLDLAFDAPPSASSDVAVDSAAPCSSSSPRRMRAAADASQRPLPVSPVTTPRLQPRGGSNGGGGSTSSSSSSSSSLSSSSPPLRRGYLRCRALASVMLVEVFAQAGELLLDSTTIVDLHSTTVARERRTLTLDIDAPRARAGTRVESLTLEADDETDARAWLEALCGGGGALRRRVVRRHAGGAVTESVLEGASTSALAQRRCVRCASARVAARVSVANRPLLLCRECALVALEQWLVNK